MKKIAVLFCVWMLSLSAQARSADDNLPKKPVKDSAATAGEALENRGFQNLFSTDKFDPTASYISQINPLAVPYIQDYMTRHGKTLEKMKSWASPYFSMMDGILMSFGIPRELKYLAVIESHLKSYATSWVGAVGPWQFMPATGRRMGLNIGRRVDERTNYYKSTYAAARYLKELYEQLGDWLLVVAAYNGGPGRVFGAIRRSGSKNFWELQYYLPEESRNHVKKFIGTHYVMEGGGGVATTTAEEWNKMQEHALAQTTALQSNLSPEELAGTDTLTIEGKYNSVVIATQLTLDITRFNKLNPNFDKLVRQPVGYKLRLPKDKMELFSANRYIILHQSILATLHSASDMSAGFPEAKPQVMKKKK